ncbi:MAG: cellulase family glycosylhydrolase [Acetobacteraceae bacterium]|nr:cellulase family glycosylhydrolase [Acetobacteraceae bacterium]
MSDQPATAASDHLLPQGFLSTNGNQIVGTDGTPVRIAAINWYGFETPNFAPTGLWAQNYKTIMNEMVQAGFNTIRLPWSDQLFDPGSTPSGIDYTLNPDLQGLTGLQIMDKIVAYAGQIGLKIILDHHRTSAGGGANANGLWYDSTYSAARFQQDWTALAQRYAGNPTIIGADLDNEPHDPATWGGGGPDDWAAAATAAAKAIQAYSPGWLMIVEGIETYSGSDPSQQENLLGVATDPIVTNVPNKIVYSVHDYPASVHPTTYDQASDYPSNLPAIWNQYWGYIYQQDIAPVFVGEFGAAIQSPGDSPWLSELTAYLDGQLGASGGLSIAAGQQGPSWAYWSWNPNQGGAGGILNDDWTVNSAQMARLAPLLYDAPASSTAVSGTSSTSSTAPVADNFGAIDQTTGVASEVSGHAYTGPVGYLRQQLTLAGSDRMAVSARVDNVFIKGSGNDALAVLGGQNVLDGGTGSNFLVGGTGTDTFFTDARTSAFVWNTIVNFRPGDMVTLYGFVAGQSSYSTTPSEGASGYQGLTVNADIAGNGQATAKVTLAGLTTSDLSHLAFSTGTVGKIPYLAIMDR